MATFWIESERFSKIKGMKESLKLKKSNNNVYIRRFYDRDYVSKSGFE